MLRSALPASRKRYAVKLKTSVYPQYAEIVTARKEAARAKPKGTAFEELQSMIGLTEAKAVIQKAPDYFKVQRLYRKTVSLWTSFARSPG